MVETPAKAPVKKPAPKPEIGPVRFAADGRRRRTFTIKYWSIRHSGLLEKLYNGFEMALFMAAPLFKAIGHERLEKPMAALERGVKGALFDCRMCGKCALSSTGMSCSMNCPKQLRNGPCGGVRANGNCEVIADMPCVWVKAWEGSRNMAGGDKILDVQKPVDQSIKETSTWLRVVREKTMESTAK
jgi:Methylene-tetrahydrofolate reductase C terminal